MAAPKKFQTEKLYTNGKNRRMVISDDGKHVRFAYPVTGKQETVTRKAFLEWFNEGGEDGPVQRPGAPNLN
jgi:hypothetical protein